METLQASVELMRRQLEHPDMRYLRLPERSLLGLLVLMCERLLPVIEQVNGLDKRMEAIDGRRNPRPQPDEDGED
jgi:hypothetical protein